MNIYKCEREAQKIGFDSAKFTAKFPAGEFECQWLDAYMGLFKVFALGDGFVTSKQMDDQFPDFECYNLRVE